MGDGPHFNTVKELVQRSMICFAFATGVALAQAPGPSGRAPLVSQPPGISAAPALDASPVDYFRQLLSMSAQERALALEKRPEDKRKSLEAKIAEYSQMTPEEREARLRLAEVWYYLQPLMNLAPAQRAARLATIPASDRPLIEERLKLWDLVPQPRRKEFLENKFAVQYFLRLDSDGIASQKPWVTKTPEEWKALEERIQTWSALPQDERQKMYHHFQEFLEMAPNEKQKTLHALSEEERQKLEKSLRTFDQLSPQQRTMFVESFQKFSDMSKEERDQFLKNAERWQEMTPRDRQTWINLMNLLPSPAGQSSFQGSPPRLLPGQSPAPVPGGTAKPHPPLPGAASKPKN